MEPLPAFRAPPLGDSIKVIAAGFAGELFDGDGVGPVEIELTRGALRIGQAAEVVPAAGAAHVERDVVPVGGGGATGGFGLDGCCGSIQFCASRLRRILSSRHDADDDPPKRSSYYFAVAPSSQRWPCA